MKSHTVLPILTTIEDGQPYVDEPVYDIVFPRKIVIAVRLTLKLSALRQIEILVRYDHVKLRWMQPDGNGGLTPR